MTDEQRQAIIDYGEGRYNIGYKNGMINGIITGVLLSSVIMLVAAIIKK